LPDEELLNRAKAEAEADEADSGSEEGEDQEEAAGLRRAFRNEMVATADAERAVGNHLFGVGRYPEVRPGVRHSALRCNTTQHQSQSHVVFYCV
jgi:hypothetical protein